MKFNLQGLAARRDALVQRSAEQRAQIGLATAGIERSLGMFDSAVATVRRIAKPPFGIAVGAALLWLLGPRRAIGWLGRGLTLMSVARSLHRLVRTVSDVASRGERRASRSRYR